MHRQLPPLYELVDDTSKQARRFLTRRRHLDDFLQSQGNDVHSLQLSNPVWYKAENCIARLTEFIPKGIHFPKTEMYSEKYFHFFSIVFSIFFYVAHFVFLRDLHSNSNTCSGLKAVTTDQSPAHSLWYTVQTGKENDILLFSGKMKNLAKPYP